MPKINEWLTADTLSGTSGVTVVRITAATQSQMEERTASFTVRGRNETVRVTAVQEAPVLDFSVSPSTVTLPWTGGSQTVLVYSTLPWTAGAGKEWLGLSPASGNPGTTEVTVTADAQTISLARSGVIDFYVFGEKVGSLTAVQEEGDVTGNVLMYTSSDGQIIVPEGIEEMGTVVGHSYEDGIGAIYFAEPVTKIPASAYSGNDRLTGIWLPSTVTEIGDHAFDTCENLKYMSIKGTVVYGYDSFGDTNIEELHVESLSQWLQCYCGDYSPYPYTEEACIGFFPMREGTVLYVGDVPMGKNLTVPADIDRVGHGALYSYPLDSIYIPDEFSGGIDSYAFCNTHSKDTYIGSGVTYIGERISAAFETSAFTGCEGKFEFAADCITYLYIGPCPKVTELSTYLTLKLGNDTFPGVITLNIKGNGKCVGPNFSFEGHSSVETINILGDGIELYRNTFKDCKALSAVNDWSKFAEIGDNAFSGCTSLNVDVELTECTLGVFAFADTAIKSFTYSSGTVNHYACTRCPYLESIDISDALIRSNAFEGCPTLSEVRFTNISEVHTDAFKGSDNIDNVYTDSLEWWLHHSWRTPETNPLHGGAALWESGTMVTDISPVYDANFWTSFSEYCQNALAGCSSVTGATITYTIPNVLNAPVGDGFEGYFQGSAIRKLILKAPSRHVLHEQDLIISSGFLKNCRDIEVIILATPSRFTAEEGAFTGIRSGGKLLVTAGAETDDNISGAATDGSLAAYGWSISPTLYRELPPSGGTASVTVESDSAWTISEIIQ